MADANLGDLFKVAPTTAGWMLGGQLATDDQNQALKQRETLQDILTKQQAYDQNTQMNPLLVDKQRTLNQGFALDNDRVGLANDTTRRTQNSTIDATNTKNASEILGGHLKQAQQTEEFFNRAADQLVTMPPPMRASWLAGQMKSVNMDPNDPAVQQYVQQASQNPQMLKQHAAAIAQERAARTPEYIKAMEEERLKAASALAVAQEHSRGSAESSRIIAGGRVQVANIKQSKSVLSTADLIKQGKIPIERQAAAWTQAARDAENDEDKLYALKQADLAEQASQNHDKLRGNTEVKDGNITTTPPKRIYSSEPGKSDIDALIDKYAK